MPNGLKVTIVFNCVAVAILLSTAASSEPQQIGRSEIRNSAIHSTLPAPGAMTVAATTVEPLRLVTIDSHADPVSSMEVLAGSLTEMPE